MADTVFLCIFSLQLYKISLSNSVNMTINFLNPLCFKYKIYIYIITLYLLGAPVFWPLDVKSQLVGKDPEAGKD